MTLYTWSQRQLESKTIAWSTDQQKHDKWHLKAVEMKPQNGRFVIILLTPYDFLSSVHMCKDIFISV